MKIIKKADKALIKCKFCGCEYLVQGKDWRRMNKDPNGSYTMSCPNCYYWQPIIPGEVKCKK